jgi:ribosomal protein L37E
MCLYLQIFMHFESLDSTVDYEMECSKCGNRGVIYRKELCHSCYFGFENREESVR